MGWDLFVSYAHQDDEPDGWVTALVQAIRAEHAQFTPTPLRVFFDRHDIRTMDDWERRIMDGLHASKLMLAVLSEHYFRSAYCRQEWRVYRDHEIRRQMLGESIAPIYIVTVPAFAGPAGNPADPWQSDLWQRADLERRQYLDLRAWRPHGVHALQQLEVRQRLRSLDQQLAERLARVRRGEESRNTVPRASDRFVGRKGELTKLRSLLPQGKVAAITAVQGIGGIGKTALAFLYSQAFADHYPGGRFLVDAAGLGDLRIVLLRLASQLGVELSTAEQADLDLAAARVRTLLEQRARSLLVLDNVDQPDLLPSRARARLLPATDRLHVLVTTRLDQKQLRDAGVECLELNPLPETDALELLNKHRAISGDDEWKAALRIARLLGGHTLALEVVAVYLWKHPDVTYADYLTRLEAEGLFAALTGAAADRAVQLSENPQKLIGPLLAPTLQGLNEAELRAAEYAALVPPDSVSLPWIRDLVTEDLPHLLAARTGYADPWLEVQRRLIGLRLWTSGEDERLARIHRIVQAVLLARLPPDVSEHRRERIRRYVLDRAKSFFRSSSLSHSMWEAYPLRDYALSGMRAEDPFAVNVANWLCEPFRALGRLTDAGMLARSAVAFGLCLTAADPGNVDWQHDLSFSHKRIGNVLAAQGDLTAALASYRASLEIMQRLAAADPANADWQCDLSASHDKVGDVLSAQGDLTAALASYRASLEIMQRLAAADPANADWQRDLSVSHNLVGDVLRAQGDLSAALSAYWAGLEIRQRLAAVDPGNVGWQRDLAGSQSRIGDVHRAQGDRSAALAVYSASLEIIQRLAKADLGNAGWQRDLSVSHIKIGEVLSAKGDLSPALSAYGASLEIVQRLAAADPSNAEWQRDLWASCWKMAEVTEQQSGGEAQIWWRRAFDVLDGMQQRGLFISPEDERCLVWLRSKLGL